MNLVWLRKNRMEQKERSADHSTWQVSSSLSHAPDWDMLGFFSSRRLQECVILELRKVFGAGRKNSHIALTMCFFSVLIKQCCIKHRKKHNIRAMQHKFAFH